MSSGFSTSPLAPDGEKHRLKNSNIHYQPFVI